MSTSHKNDHNIDAPESDYLYTQLSQLQGSGYGLFTAINIYRDEIISVFKGEILTQKQVMEREEKGEDKYFIRLLNGSIMDSMKVKCFAKFANDATAYLDSKFKNNSKITLDDHHNVCIVAIRNIKMNEEIFCCYGKKYWKKHG